ncbi:MAG: hypothetical protein ACWGMZ_09585 [Thermoguttaceae bacterium]
MRVRNRMLIEAAIVACVLCCAIDFARAQSVRRERISAPQKAGATANETSVAKAAKAQELAHGSTVETLAEKQQNLAEKYQRLEELMLRMSELGAASDPGRAALLRKAVARSKEQLIDMQFSRTVELLEKDRLAQALESQTYLQTRLHDLLELLQSENRPQRIRSQKARIRDYLNRLGNALRRERDVRARTAAGDEAKRLVDEQEKIAANTIKLAQDIRANEEGFGPNGDDTGKKTRKPGEQGREDTKHARAGKQTKDEDSSPENGQWSPTRKHLQSARKKMDEALRKLEQARQKDAVMDQENAVRELEQAKADLEQILRQLREEEIHRALTMLDARFRKILTLQREVYDGTVRLDKIPGDQRTHQYEVQSGRLSDAQQRIVAETDKALLVLHEDGTVAALPEAVDQLRTDMQQVVDRLAQAKVEKITQDIELDIIASLEEIIETLKKSQKNLERDHRILEGQLVAPGESPLVDKVAELKMIRALQMRINSRTARYSKLIDGEQAEKPELVEALRRLAERQQRVYRVTHDLSSGKTE